MRGGLVVTTLLVTLATQAAGLLIGRPPLRPLSRRPVWMQLEKLTVKLVGCSSGVGVGLDGNNCVDMVRPDSPAESSELELGDRVLLWNGIEMVDFTGERRLLKDVVVPADSHTLVIERQLAAAAKPAQGAVRQESTAEKDGGSWKTQETWKSNDAWSPESWGGDTS